MAQITCPITFYAGERPSTLASSPTSGPANLYASIVCLGPAALLELFYLRPDTTQWLDNLGRPIQTATNSYDPAAKQGVAYFGACEFAWHYALLTSGRTLQLQVDDTYPGGNRIFAEAIMPSPSQATVPDVLAWLNQHTNVYNAL